jgi:hypothetical protein
MLRQIIIATITLIIVMPSLYAYESLQAVYNQAGGYGEYDKYIELNAETEYLGDLVIDTGARTAIHGNGAIIFGAPGTRAVYVYASHLDIANCIIIGGQNGIHFDTLSSGSINNNTVVDCDSIGITVYYHDYNEGAEVWDNIVVGCMYGFIRLEEWPPNYLGHNTVFDSDIFRYGDYCPS